MKRTILHSTMVFAMLALTASCGFELYFVESEPFHNLRGVGITDLNTELFKKQIDVSSIGSGPALSKLIFSKIGPTDKITLVEFLERNGAICVSDKICVYSTLSYTSRHQIHPRYDKTFAHTGWVFVLPVERFNVPEDMTVHTYASYHKRAENG